MYDYNLSTFCGRARLVLVKKWVVFSLSSVGQYRNGQRMDQARAVGMAIVMHSSTICYNTSANSFLTYKCEI